MSTNNDMIFVLFGLIVLISNETKFTIEIDEDKHSYFFPILMEMSLTFQY